MLKNAIAAGRLTASTDTAIVAAAEHVIVVIGTPVDEHLNPDQVAITKALHGCSEYLRSVPWITHALEAGAIRTARSAPIARCLAETGFRSTTASTGSRSRRPAAATQRRAT